METPSEDGGMRASLEAVWQEEVLPVFAAMGTPHGDAALAYVAQVRERFSNPFLAHRLADIAQHHGQVFLARGVLDKGVQGKLGPRRRQCAGSRVIQFACCQDVCAALHGCAHISNYQK